MHETNADAAVIEPVLPLLRCEIAVVGSGPGGAITACLLAEAGRDVLLIEEGPNLGLESCLPFSIDEMAQKYRNGGLTSTLGRVKVQYVEGRCVGGGSEINSGLYHRTPLDILEKWRVEFQVDALREEDLLPHFEACERDLKVGCMPGEAPAASSKLHEGARRLNWTSIEVPRWYSYDPPTGGERMPRARRRSMTQTFIPRALRAGCRLLSSTRVRKLRRRSTSGWELHAEHRAASQHRSIRVEADHVFICGGAVQTPALLRRSGIRENVGNSLRLHPMIKVVARFPDVVNSLDMGVPVHQVKEFAPRISLGGSISTPPYLAIALRDSCFDGQLLDQWQHLAVYYAATISNGSGSIRCLLGYHDPVVRYRITQRDLQELSEALRRLSETLFAAGATTLYPSASRSAPLTTPDDLRRLPDVLDGERSNLMTVHLFSSCPMGEDRRRCATDSFGRVHGHDNLYVSDASLLCTAPGVNPQGSIMALARRNALAFLQR